MLSCLKGRVCLLQGLLLLGFVGCSSAFQGGETNQGEIPISNAQVAEKVIELSLENAGIPCGHGTIVSCKVDGDSEEDSLLGMIALEFLLKHGYRVVENNDSLVASRYAESEARRVQRSDSLRCNAVETKNEIPEIRFGLDTLYVNLYPRLDRGSRTKNIRCVEAQRVSKLIRRHSDPPAIVVRRAGAHTGIVFLKLSVHRGLINQTLTKKVYKGRGVMEDTFPFHLLPSVGNGESFTTIFPEQDPRLVRGIKKNVQPFLLGITMTALVWLLYSYRG